MYMYFFTIQNMYMHACMHISHYQSWERNNWEVGGKHFGWEMVLGAKRLGYGGRNDMGGNDLGETSWGRNDLLPSSPGIPSHVPGLSYIWDINPSTVSVSAATNLVVSPFQVAIVLGKKENLSLSVYALGWWYWKGWDLVLLLPLPASERYLFLSIMTRLLGIL